MKFEEMKRIADARTKGEWSVLSLGERINSRHKVMSNWSADPLEITGDLMDIWDAKFIAMAANNWDKLIAVVEALKNLSNDGYLDEQMGSVFKALEELEKE